MQRPDILAILRNVHAGGGISRRTVPLLADYILALEAARDAVLPHTGAFADSALCLHWTCDSLCRRCAFDAAVAAHTP